MSELTLSSGVTIPQLRFGVFQVPPRSRETCAASALVLSSEEPSAITALEPGARKGPHSAVASFTQL